MGGPFQRGSPEAPRVLVGEVAVILKGSRMMVRYRHLALRAVVFRRLLS